MKYISLFLISICPMFMSAKDPEKNHSVAFKLNEMRDWKSLDEVYAAYGSLTWESKNRDSNLAQQIAISTGLRSVERVLEAIQGECKKTPACPSIQSVVAKGRSIVDIAIFGLMIALGETAKYPTGSLSEQLNKTYKSNEIALDVARERTETLESLTILIKIKAEKTDQSE